MFVAGVLCGVAAIVCATFGLWSLLRPGAAVAKMPTRLAGVPRTRSIAPAQLAAAVMLAAGGAVTLAGPRPVALALVGMCVVGAVGTIAAGSWQSARYALRPVSTSAKPRAAGPVGGRDTTACGGDCAACTLSCR